LIAVFNGSYPTKTFDRNLLFAGLTDFRKDQDKPPPPFFTARAIEFSAT